MWKTLLIVILVFYILNKLGLFRVYVQSNGRTHRYSSPNSHRKPADGNVNIDSMPEKKKSTYKGGEYVDYEEVK